MQQISSVEAVRAAERRAFEIVGDEALMQRAAAGLARIVADLAHGRGVLIVAGPGNNGGDGLFAGARLAAAGTDVRVWQTASTIHEAGLSALLDAGGRQVDAVGATAALADDPVVIDAVYGIGARPGLPDDVATFADACRDTGVLVVACDLPSGLAADEPGAGAPSFTAQRTVTFGARKRCQVLEPARSCCGEVTLVDIGLDGPEFDVVCWELADVAAHWPFPGPESDKYSRGVVGIDTGSDTYPGAGLLSTHGAAYSGAGMVRYLGAERVKDLLAVELPNIVQAPGRVQAWVVGSGWGDRSDGDARLAEILGEGVPVIVDADGLRHLPERLDRDDVLLTPHAGELARLLGVERAEVESDPLTFVRQAAGRFGVTVLLKGATQYVARAGEPLVEIAYPGPAWTAQAGSGDVLAGLCGTLLAAGLAPHVAALVAASVQARNAELHPGPWPPQDMARTLPETIASLLPPA